MLQESTASKEQPQRSRPVTRINRSLFMTAYWKITYRDVTTRLLLRISDLAVVNDKSVTRSTTTSSPADALGERGVGVAKEELSSPVRCYKL